MMASALFVAAQGRADTIAFSPSGLTSVGDSNTSEPGGNDSLFFTPNSAISVTGLGYVLGNPEGTTVGLYAASGDTLLASATVSDSDPNANGFAYAAITPVLLTAGTEYAISGFYPGEPTDGYYAYGGVGAASGITFDGYAYDYNGSFDLGDVSYSPAIFGPNFEYVASVPDSGSSSILLVIGMAGIGLASASRLNRQRRA